MIQLDVRIYFFKCWWVQPPTSLCWGKCSTLKEKKNILHTPNLANKSLPIQIIKIKEDSALPVWCEREWFASTSRQDVIDEYDEYDKLWGRTQAVPPWGLGKKKHTQIDEAPNRWESHTKSRSHEVTFRMKYPNHPIESNRFSEIIKTFGFASQEWYEGLSNVIVLDPAMSPSIMQAQKWLNGYSIARNPLGSSRLLSQEWC